LENWAKKKRVRISLSIDDERLAMEKEGKTNRSGCAEQVGKEVEKKKIFPQKKREGTGKKGR